MPSCSSIPIDDWIPCYKGGKKLNAARHNALKNVMGPRHDDEGNWANEAAEAVATTPVDNELWTVLLEKGFTKIGNKKYGTQTVAGGYRSLDGGFIPLAWLHMTGNENILLKK